MNLTRKDFLQYAAFSTIGIALPSLVKGQTSQDKPAPIPLEVVKEFVGASHGKFDRVKEMLAPDPNLIHCRHDWTN